MSALISYFRPDIRSDSDHSERDTSLQAVGKIRLTQNRFNTILV
jgi:hypothetical protein